MEDEGGKNGKADWETGREKFMRNLGINKWTKTKGGTALVKVASVVTALSYISLKN